MHTNLIRTFLCLIVLNGTIFAQSKGKGGTVQTVSKHGVVGTWRAIRYETWDSAGLRSMPFGDPPSGYAVFDATGFAFIQLMGTQKRENGNGIEQSPIFGAYYGSYVLVAHGDTIKIHVEGSNILNYINTVQVRPFRIFNDTLSLGIPGEYQATLVRMRR